MPIVRDRRFLFGISVAVLAAIGGATYWVFTFLIPPKPVVELVRLLNGPESDFYNALRNPRDDYGRYNGDWRPAEVESLKRFKSKGKGPWELTWWERSKARNHFNMIVRDGNGDHSHLRLIMTVPGWKIGNVQYWPYVKGKSLDEIADSAMKITKVRALAVAYWKDGRYECEVRGTRSLTGDEPLRETDRWPLQFTNALVQLATARLVEKGVLDWKELIKNRFPTYQLPDWANGLSLEQLFRSGERMHFSGSGYGKPVPKKVTLADSLRALFNSDGYEGGDARLSESSDMTVLIGILHAVTGEPVHKTIEREVLRPLDMHRTHFGKPDIELTPLELQYHFRGSQYIADRAPISAPISEFMELGKLKLAEEARQSRFLRPEQFEKLHSEWHFQNKYQFKWEWQQHKLPEGIYYEFQRSSVMMGVFPKQNAVVIVAMPTLSEPHTSLGGPVFWRIAEQICGWPRKLRLGD